MYENFLLFTSVLFIHINFDLLVTACYFLNCAISKQTNKKNTLKTITKGPLETVAKLFD